MEVARWLPLEPVQGAADFPRIAEVSKLSIRLRTAPVCQRIYSTVNMFWSSRD